MSRKVYARISSTAKSGIKSIPPVLAKNPNPGQSSLITYVRGSLSEVYRRVETVSNRVFQMKTKLYQVYHSFYVVGTNNNAIYQLLLRPGSFHFYISGQGNKLYGPYKGKCNSFLYAKLIDGLLLCFHNQVISQKKVK